MKRNKLSMGGMCAATVVALLVSPLGAASATEAQSGQQSIESGIEAVDGTQSETVSEVVSEDEETVGVEEVVTPVDEQLSDLPEGFVPDPLELTESIPDQDELPSLDGINAGMLRGAYDGFYAPAQIGQGWGSTTPVFAGNANRQGPVDLYGINSKGLLYFYERTVRGNFDATQVGNGWNELKNVTGGWDLTGDGIPDVIGVDRAGKLRIYRGLGDGRVAFHKALGNGWLELKKIAVAPYGPNKKPVIYGIYTNGALRQYLTDGKGNIVRTVEFGNGWSGMREIIGVQDWDGDGYSDLIAVTSNGDMRIYFGSGSAGSLREPLKIGNGWQVMTSVINGVNTKGDQAIWAVDKQGRLWEYSKLRGGSTSSNIVSIARKYFGVPYVWGGSDPSGFDCSGLVSYVYREAGKPFNPWRLNTTGITNQARAISASQAQPGDILSWPGHVAIYVSPGVMIDAPKPGYTVGQRAIWGSPTYYRFP